MISNAKADVNLSINEEPAALGWTAVISPERPIPWLNLQTKELNLNECMA